LDAEPVAPEWNRRKANTLLLSQAARLEAIVNLLERKGLITRSELVAATTDVLRNEKARLIATMITAGEPATGESGV
jgi:hypothetical protein